MRLLITTQKVDENDPILGFFHAWLKEFAERTEAITVICLERGKISLPKNIRVISLGKEEFRNENLFFKRITYALKFLKHIIKERHEYDKVFVHMNPEYVLLGGVFWKLWRKKIILWYNHREVTLRLRLAVLLADKILTAAPESFRIRNKKVKSIGHGINVSKFKRPDNFKSSHRELSIVSVGRITPIKNLDILIETGAILKQNNIPFIINIIGGPVVPSDNAYLEKLKTLVKEKKLESEIIFLGTMSNNEIAPYYWRSDLSVNLTPTGGIDKAVLESMAAGTVSLASNTAFAAYFEPHGKQLIFKERDSKNLADKIIALKDEGNRKTIATFLRAKAEEGADIRTLVDKVFTHLL